ncbi:hypothetical protein KSS87_015259, partial [Heliosperma pusillum]
MKEFRFEGQSEARKKLGAPKKQLQRLWNRSVTLRHIISLLDQIEGLSKVPGELDTKYGGPSYLGAMLRRFYNVCGVVRYDKREKLRYVVRGNLGFHVLSDDSVRFNVNGQCDVGKDLKKVHACGFKVYSSVAITFQKM